MLNILITGISGQDGSYLAKLLLENGHNVFGTTRSIEKTKTHLKLLNISEHVALISSTANSLAEIIRMKEFDQIYHLACESKVGLSFQNPKNTYVSINSTTLEILEELRLNKHHAKCFFAGSSEVYGNCDSPMNELSPHTPKSPYALAKSHSFSLVKYYREVYGLRVCTGVLGNHDSILRPNDFVLKKIIISLLDIYHQKQSVLELGNTTIIRDWGWAPDYVIAMKKVLDQDNLDDFIIATGLSVSLESLVLHACDKLNLIYSDVIVMSYRHKRDHDIKKTILDCTKINKVLGWSSSINGSEVIDNLLNFYN